MPVEIVVLDIQNSYTCPYSTKQQYTTKPIRYKLSEANWGEYQKKIKLPSSFENENIACNLINSNITETADICIPKTKPNINTKYSVFWWRDSCKVALSY